MSDFLFEMGVEEVPVSEIPPIMKQLREKLEKGLEENLVQYKYVEAAATNRRFMVYIDQLNEKADDTDEQIKGPAKRIAYDDNGKPTMALTKFMEFNQVKAGDIKEMETKKGVYLAIDKKTQGRPTRDILAGLLPRILGKLSFGKTMVWNSSRLPFVRPLKNLLALFDGDVIPFEYAGVSSGNTTYGHILLSEKTIEVNNYLDYCELLTRNFVLVREDDRRKKIIDEITDVEEEYKANIKPDTSMLDDYVYNNEYPVVFHGEFDKQYLDLPPEIISTFMIREKKLLPVYDKKNNLINVFIGVSNIPDENKFVMHGNERVIRATFEDAKFFWDSDRKENFTALRENLKNVMFHKGLGTYYEKTDRLFALVDKLAEDTGNTDIAENLKKAALYCKNDLVTQMVREFPSLQGIMGGLYLKEAGAEEALWKAVYGHYEPKGFVKVRLQDVGAGLLSVADKIDGITGFLSKGIKISSSKDPYGVRRDANAIIKIMLEFKLDIDITGLIRAAAGHFLSDEQEREKLVTTVSNLFLGRVENVFKDFMKYRYDVVNAAVNTRELNFFRMHLRAHSVGRIVEMDHIQDLSALHKRLKNIIKKSEPAEVEPRLLVENEEKLLYDIFKETKAKIEASFKENDYLQGCSQFLEMKPVIDGFFDKVLVMAEDPNVRRNRIALLQQLDKLLMEIADFSLIVEAKQ